MLTKIATAVWNPKRPFLFLASLSLLFTFFSCSTTPKESQFLECNQETHIRQGVDFYPPSWNTETASVTSGWESVAQGILYTSFTSNQIPLRWHLVSIDLHNHKIQPIAYPTLEQIQGKSSFTGKTTWQFLKDSSATVALNANPFQTPFTPLFPQRSIEGLYINQGKLVSSAIARYSALCFEKQSQRWIPSIISDQTQYPPQTELALGGFFTILKEGENKKESTGLSYEESALILQAVGAWDALQMDGGGSASLSVTGKTITGRHHRRAANILAFAPIFQ